MPKSAPVHQIFKACADPTRLRILHMLRGGELCVCDIVDVLSVSQPKVSRHLATLRKTGLVDARKEGLWIHYSLRRAENPLHKKLLETIGACGPLDTQLAADARKLARLKSKNSCCR